MLILLDSEMRLLWHFWWAERKFLSKYTPICSAKSTVCKAAFDGNFLQSCDRSINLPEEEPAVFEKLYSWI